MQRFAYTTRAERHPVDYYLNRNSGGSTANTIFDDIFPRVSVALSDIELDHSINVNRNSGLFRGGQQCEGLRNEIGISKKKKRRIIYMRYRKGQCYFKSLGGPTRHVILETTCCLETLSHCFIRSLRRQLCTSFSIIFSLSNLRVWISD